MNIAQAMLWAQSLGLERLDTQLLLLHALGRAMSDRAWLVTHDQEPVGAATTAVFSDAVRRRVLGEPLAYVVGHKEFFGLRLLVDHRVLVPRPDTETLVTWSLELLEQWAGRDGPIDAETRSAEPATVLDLGTGSGAVALAIKRKLPSANVLAVDNSPHALAVAAANASRLKLDVRIRQSAWFEEVTGLFHLVVANPPYICDDDPHLEALRFEPRQALTSGADGLADIRSILAQAPPHLRPGAWLLLEHGYTQAGAVRALMAERGFTRVQSRTDLAGIERCSGGQWPGAR